MKVILTRGLMASGKSTWAKEFIKNHPSYKRISRDDFRHMTNFYDFEQKGSEELVTNLVYTALEQCIKEDYNIILDETNLNDKTMKKNLVVASL